MIRVEKAVILFCTIPFSMFSQTIDNTSFYRNLDSDSYCRFHYENDFFASTDHYYSQGLNIEIVLPALIKNPLNLLLPKLNNRYKTYGLSLEHAVFTPLSIRRSEISYNDRPFAAYFILKSFLTSTDTLRQQRLSSTISLGLLGPSAFGYEMQRNIHKWLDNIEPLGWEHQISDEALVNYELIFERQLYLSRNRFLLSSIVGIQAGSLMSNVQAGVTMMAGIFNSSFSNLNGESGRRYKLYVYAQPLIKGIAHNATLEGGWLNGNETYELGSQKIERIVFQSKFGIVVGFYKTTVELSQSIISEEFISGKSHRYGAIRIGLRF